MVANSSGFVGLVWTQGVFEQIFVRSQICPVTCERGLSTSFREIAPLNNWSIYSFILVIFISSYDLRVGNTNWVIMLSVKDCISKVSFISSSLCSASDVNPGNVSIPTSPQKCIILVIRRQVFLYLFIRPLIYNIHAQQLTYDIYIWCYIVLRWIWYKDGTLNVNHTGQTEKFASGILGTCDLWTASP